eukprot:366466-Chlamydomonas_euryale.AAC.18
MSMYTRMQVAACSSSTCAWRSSHVCMLPACMPPRMLEHACMSLPMQVQRCVAGVYVFMCVLKRAVLCTSDERRLSLPAKSAPKRGVANGRETAHGRQPTTFYARMYVQPFRVDWNRAKHLLVGGACGCWSRRDTPHAM